ncbi:acyl-CoA dehydrogenase family protein [Rhizorhabdus argentea]|uniref:acyl-CoA dehydrogenase family protein n=1 Tax=Rhizorhabdus argentea TaxID=1387174 RepID=UPI0030EF3D5A
MTTLGQGLQPAAPQSTTSPDRSGSQLFGPELEDFRSEVRSFIRENLDPAIAERTRRISFFENWDDKVSWNKTLHQRGWSMPHWPVEYGGCGWSALQIHIFEQECFAADAPRVPFMGRYLVGPVIYTFGSDWQKERFLPRILAGEETWAQGFSEPNAGSDLTSLRTRAELIDGEFVVNGQKMWTTDGHVADWGFFLVRTDPTQTRGRGLSFILIDLRSPGVTIRPIRTIDGRQHVNEIFLEDVRVPEQNLVGEAGRGWDYANFLLGNERTTSAEIYWSKRELAKARHLLQSRAARAFNLDAVRTRLARAEMDALALEFSVLRELCGGDGVSEETAVASSLKVRGARLQQRISELQMDIIGIRALRMFDEEDILAHDETRAPLWPNIVVGKTSNALLLCGASIYGGSEEIQKNIIAKRGFGL